MAVSSGLGQADLGILYISSLWSAVSGSAATTKRKDPTNGKSATVKLGKRKGQPASYTTANPAAVDVGPSRPQPPAKRPRASSPLHQSVSFEFGPARIPWLNVRHKTTEGEKQGRFRPRQQRRLLRFYESTF